MTDKKWLTPREAAPLLGLSVREVQDRCNAVDPITGRTVDDLPGITHRRLISPGGRVRFLIHVDAVEVFIRKTTVFAK